VRLVPYLLGGLVALGCAETTTRGITHLSVWGDRGNPPYFYLAYGEGPGADIEFSRLMRCTVHPDNSVACVPEPEADRILAPNAPPAQPRKTQAAPTASSQPVPAQTPPAPPPPAAEAGSAAAPAPEPPPAAPASADSPPQ
jgi:hypothetical protein